MSKLSRFFGVKSKDCIIDELRDKVSELNLRIGDLKQSHFNHSEEAKKHHRNSVNGMIEEIECLKNSSVFQQRQHESNIAEIESYYEKRINEIEAKHEVKISELKKGFAETRDEETAKIRKSVEKEFNDKLMELESEIELLKSTNEELRDEISDNNEEYFDSLGKYEGALEVIKAKTQEIERLNKIVEKAFGSLPTVSASIKTAGDNTVNIAS